MKQNHIQIKPLSSEQLDEWMPLWKGYQSFYQSDIPEHVTATTWQKLTDPDQQHMYGFAALVDKQVVGIVHIIEHDSCWTTQPYAYLQDLYVNEQFRNQGIARKLIEYVQQVANERNCDRLYWLTHESNQSAQLLYDRIARKTGFIQYRCP